MNNSSKLCAASGFFLCMVYLLRDSCLPLGHKCEDLDPPAHKQLREAFCSLTLGTEGYSDSQRKMGFLFLLACTPPLPLPHKHTKLHTCDMKSSWYSWNCFSFLSIIPSFLLERVPCQEVVSSTLMPVFRLRFTPGLFLNPRHCWLEYARNWRVAVYRSWRWQEGFKRKDSICRGTSSRWKGKTEGWGFFFFAFFFFY